MSAQSPSPEDRHITDEEWATFQSESEGPARLTAPKEPSARARMVTERLRLQDEEYERSRRRGGLGRKGRSPRRNRAARPSRRTRRNLNSPPPPDGWRTGPSPYGPNGRTGGGSSVKAVVGVVLVIVLLLIALNPERTLPWLF
jgi:hypothetical protein